MRKITSEITCDGCHSVLVGGEASQLFLSVRIFERLEREPPLKVDLDVCHNCAATRTLQGLMLAFANAQAG